MGHSISSADRSQEVNPLDRVRPRMAKASLDGQTLSIEMRAIVRNALICHFGSLKAAAIEMGMDQGQLTRELDAGKLNLARLEKCGPAFLLKFGSLMVEHAQPLASPKARWQELKQRQRQIDDERDQLFEHVAS